MTPFNTAYQISRNADMASKRRAEISALDEILSQAKKQDRQEQIDELLNQVITRVRPENQKGALDVLGARKKEIAQRQQQQQYDQYAESIGLPRGTPSDILKSYAQNVSKRNPEEEKRNIDTIQQNFGSDAANLYSALPTGAQTKFFDELLQNAMRENKVEDIMKKFRQYEPKLKSENEIEKENFDKGLTPKEKVKRQDDRYKINLPLQQKSEAKRKSLEAIDTDLDILSELSPQITTTDRFNIDPRSGNLFVPALASPAAQRFVKTINDFTTQAKDTFGARVTNFDLNQFLKRLPNLSNSEEGRRQILEQMKLINEINLLYENGLKETIDQYGGIRNIDFDKAESITEKKIKPQIKLIKERLKLIGKDLDKTDHQIRNDKVANLRKSLPADRVIVETSDGQIGTLLKSELNEFLQVEGNRRL